MVLLPLIAGIAGALATEKALNHPRIRPYMDKARVWTKEKADEAKIKAAEAAEEAKRKVTAMRKNGRNKSA